MEHKYIQSISIDWNQIDYDSYLQGIDALKNMEDRGYIHLLVSVSLHLSAGKLVQYIKGNTSRKSQMEYKELNKQFWGQYLWARGCFMNCRNHINAPIVLILCCQAYMRIGWFSLAYPF